MVLKMIIFENYRFFKRMKLKNFVRRLFKDIDLHDN